MENLEQPGFQQCLRMLEMLAHDARMSLEEQKALIERQAVIAEMDRQDWNQCKVAAKLKIHRNTVWRILKRAKIDASEIRFVRRINRKPPESAPVGRRYKRA